MYCPFLTSVWSVEHLAFRLFRNMALKTKKLALSLKMHQIHHKNCKVRAKVIALALYTAGSFLDGETAEYV